MLVFKRSADEEIMIGDNIRIVIVAANAGHCRIGIDAPRDVPVHRREIYDAIKADEAAHKKELQETDHDDPQMA